MSKRKGKVMILNNRGNHSRSIFNKKKYLFLDKLNFALRHLGQTEIHYKSPFPSKNVRHTDSQTFKAIEKLLRQKQSDMGGMDALAIIFAQFLIVIMQLFSLK